jgi:hypothetical protein
VSKFFQVYGVVRDGVVYRMRSDRIGTTGILPWRSFFSRADRQQLRLRMYAALHQMTQQMTAPSRNQEDRMRKRGQA